MRSSARVLILISNALILVVVTNVSCQSNCFPSSPKLLKPPHPCRFMSWTRNRNLSGLADYFLLFKHDPEVWATFVLNAFLLFSICLTFMKISWFTTFIGVSRNRVQCCEWFVQFSFLKTFSCCKHVAEGYYFIILQCLAVVEFCRFIKASNF